MTTPLTVSAERTTRRAALARRVRWLVAATISYNVMEAVVAISAGTVANSAALLGFGLDSVIEVSSAAAVAWQFAAADPERREKTALRIIAISFFALAGYVTIDAVATLSGRKPPARIIGVVERRSRSSSQSRLSPVPPQRPGRRLS